MKSFEYINYLINNMDLYILSCVIVIILYFIVYKKYVIGILDPLFISIVLSGIGFSTVIFLFLIKEIKIEYFIHYILTQTAYLTGFLFFKPINLRTNLPKKKIKEENRGYCFFVMASSIIIIFQMVIFYFNGFPILHESRLNFLNGNIVFNFLERIKEMFTPGIILLSYFFMNSNKKNRKNYSKLIIVIFVLFTILYGSKSAFFVFLQFYFLYAIFMKRNGDETFIKKLNKNFFKLLFLAVLIALLVIVISEKSSNPLFFLSYRFIVAGDIYYMSYPNEIIEKFVSDKSFIINLFASPLRMLGLISESDVPTSLGFDIMRYHEGYEIFKGPNPRHNVFGYVYIGFYGAIIFSFILGLLTSFFRNKVFNLMSYSPISLVIYSTFLVVGLTLEVDYHNAQSAFINGLILLLVIGIFKIIFFRRSKNEIFNNNTDI